jgi:hypothetical protein
VEDRGGRWHGLTAAEAWGGVAARLASDSPMECDDRESVTQAHGRKEDDCIEYRRSGLRIGDNGGRVW